LSDERDQRCRDVDTRDDIAPTDIVSGDARGSQQRNIPLQKFKAKLDNLNDTGLSRHYPRLEAVRAAV
jgi:hypothetical protein